MKKVTSGGGWPAIRYAWKTARRSGVIRFLKAMSSRNACKTCALGMGGQRGGMTDESGRFPEVCKKSMQAMAADMQAPIAPAFFEKHTIAELRDLTPFELEHLGRLHQPLLAADRDSHYRPITWDEALAFCARRLKSCDPQEHFFYSSGRSSNEAAFLLQLFARLYGTNHVNNCSYYCHQASGVGLSSTLGTGTATIVLDDLDHCDFLFLIGGNPASNHPRLMRKLMEIRRRDGEVVVINPLRETGLVNFSVPSDVRSLMFGSEIASLYVQPHIGGDMALLCGIQKAVLESGREYRAFLEQFTEGADQWFDYLRKLTWEEIERSSGVDIPTIRQVADRYARSRNAVFCWTMGITHHRFGSDNVRAIVNTALLRGMLGRKGAGLMPIRGHSNVQGVGSVGVTPALKKAVFDRLESHFGVKLPTTPGMDTLSCLEAMATRQIKAGWCLGGNLYGASPDLAFAASAMGSMDSLVYFSTTMNTGHAWGTAKDTLIIPVLARDEEPQPTTQESMFNFVRLSDGGRQRLDGPRSEVELIATIAENVLGPDGPVDWSTMRAHKRIREAIAAIVPGFEELGRIDETGHEFHIRGRTYHQPKFKTPSGKARCSVTPIPTANGDDRLRLMTIRSEGQFNTVVYEEHDLYRGQERRDVILMNAADMKRLGIGADALVSVTSETGRLDNIRAREFDIREGNTAMYFPEANVLIDRTPDPESRTPAFKGARITVQPQHRP